MTEKIVRYNPIPVAEVAHGVFQPYPKLVRFQRTNHAWTDGIYDDSLPISHREGVAGAIPEVDWSNQPVNKKQFRLEKLPRTHHCFPKFYIFLKGGNKAGGCFFKSKAKR